MRVQTGTITNAVPDHDQLLIIGIGDAHIEAVIGFSVGSTTLKDSNYYGGALRAIRVYL